MLHINNSTYYITYIHTNTNNKKRVFGIRRRAYRLFSRVHKGFKIKNQQLKQKCQDWKIEIG